MKHKLSGRVVNLSSAVKSLCMNNIYSSHWEQNADNFTVPPSNIWITIADSTSQPVHTVLQTP